MEEYTTFLAIDIPRKKIWEYSCDLNKLCDWSKDPNKPNFLSQCFFKKEVLNKYYSSWEKPSMPIDNDHKDYVMVYLWDLWTYLEYGEQLYRKSFNIRPNEKTKISKSSFDNDYMVKFTKLESPDYKFKDLYTKINELRKEKYWYSLFLELKESDIHRRKSFKIPLYNNQKSFDDETHNLWIILIDALNEKDLSNWIKLDDWDKWITKFGKQIEKLWYTNRNPLITLIRNIRDLRNWVHLKWNDYKRWYEYFDIEKNWFIDWFIYILESLNKELASLLERMIK